MATVFNNMSDLDEMPNDIDQLGFDEEIDRVKNRIESKIKSNKSLIVAYLGSFGVGKSTILKNVKKEIKYKPGHWIVFEPWRYSNRNELWDAFVTKVVSTLKNKDEQNIAKEIDDGENQFLKLTGIFVVAVVLFCVLSTLSLVIYIEFKTTVWMPNFLIDLIRSYLKYALPVIIPGTLFAVFAIFLNKIATNNPLKRIFQFESLLLNTIKLTNVPIVIVIEDIDRSGDDGLVFMETLHEFIHIINLDNEIDQPVIVIAPQSPTSFNALDTGRDRVQHIEHSLKVYDEKIYFNANIGHEQVEEFYRNLKYAKKYEKYKPTMVEITRELNFYYKNDQLTIRMLKHALREVDWFIESYPDHNPSVVLVYALARMLRSSGVGATKLAVNNLKGQVKLGGDYNNGHHITNSSVLLACLGIAAGADSTGFSTGFLDKDGRYTKCANISSIKLMNDKNNSTITIDEIEVINNTLNVYLRDTYKRQFIS